MANLRSLVISSGTITEISNTNTLIVGTKVDAASGQALSIGDTNATSITIGKAGTTTNFPGPVTLTGNVTTVAGTTFTTDVTFGDANTDTVTFVAKVNSNLTFAGGSPTYKITNLANGTNPNDAVNYSQLSALVTGVSSVSASAPLSSSGGATPNISLTGTVGVTNGGTGTNTAFTAGSIVFAGPSGVYAQDNANLFWDNTNDRLGIGTASPAGSLVVNNGANAVSPLIVQDNAIAVFTIADGGDTTIAPVSGHTGNALTITGGTLASTKQALSVTGTLSTTAAAQSGAALTFTANTGSATSVVGQQVSTSGTATPSSYTIAVFGSNTLAGTGTQPYSTNTSAGNYAGYFGSAGSTAGHNVGVIGRGSSGAQNYGVIGQAVISGVGKNNLGVYGNASNANGGVNIGGLFSMTAADVAPTLDASAALIADNAGVAAPIFLGRDNGSTVLTVADGGNVGIGSSATAPSSIFSVQEKLLVDTNGRLTKYNNAAPTDGQLLIGDTAAGYWKAGTLSAGTTGLTYTNGAGSITLGGTLGVANGGTGTSTAFTQGSVVFAGPSGVYAQDNANLFWDNTNDRLGIGTATPASVLQVDGKGTVGEDTFILSENGVTRFRVESLGLTLIQPGSFAGSASVLELSSASGASGYLLTMDARSTNGTAVRQYLGAANSSPTKGLQIDWSSNYLLTNPSNWVMTELKAPSVTKTANASASTYVVLDLPYSGTVTHSTTNTLTWYGQRIQMPTVSKAASGGTLNAYGLQVEVGPFSSNYGAASGLRITASGTGSATNVGLAGIDIANTTPGTSEAYGIQIGTGWNLGVASFSPIAIATSQNYNGVSCLSMDPFAAVVEPASVEIKDVQLSARTLTRAAGAVTDQRSVQFNSQTYSFSAASTISNATLLEVTPPKAGNNATVTNARGVHVKTADVTTGSGSVDNAFGLYVDAPTGATRNYAAQLNGLTISQGGAPVDTGVGKFSTLVASVIPLNAQTASTEIVDVLLGSIASSTVVQYNAGALARQRSVAVINHTYAFTSSSTITDAATFYVNDAPVAGTNATITNPWALWVDDGNTRLDGALIYDADKVYKAEFYDEMIRGTGLAIDSKEEWDATSTGTSSGQGSSPTSPNGNDVGVQQMTTGTATNSGINYALGTITMIAPGFGTLVARARVRIPTLSTATEEFVFRFGFADTASQTEGTDYALFEYDRATAGSNIWRTTTGNDGVTASSNESSVVAGTWYDLRIEFNAASTSITYYIDDTLVHTQTGGSVPTSVDEFSVLLQIYKSAGTSARTAQVDYVYVRELFTAERG